MGYQNSGSCKLGPSDFPKLESTLINIILDQPLYICFDVDVLHWIFVLPPPPTLFWPFWTLLALFCKSNRTIRSSKHTRSPKKECSSTLFTVIFGFVCLFARLFSEKEFSLLQSVRVYILFVLHDCLGDITQYL